MEVPAEIIWVAGGILLWQYLGLPALALQYDFVKDVIWKRAREEKNPKQAP